MSHETENIKKERNYTNEPNRHSGVEHYNNGNSKFTIMVQKKVEQAEERIRKYKITQLPNYPI